MAFVLSRTSRYRMFRAEGGIAEQIRQRRNEIAHSLLRVWIRVYDTTNLIACAMGFSEVRSLRRALRDFYGATLSKLREPKMAEEFGPDRSILAIETMFDRTKEENRLHGIDGCG